MSPFKIIIPALILVGCAATEQPVKKDAQTNQQSQTIGRDASVKRENKPSRQLPVAKKAEKVEKESPDKENKETTADKDKEEIKSELDDKQLKRQTLFAVACEQHKLVQGLAQKYEKHVEKFFDGANNKQDVIGLSSIIINYKLKSDDKKPVARVQCTLRETVNNGKPSIRIVTLAVNGINVK